MAPVMAMGEASGVAAVQVVREHISFKDVNIDILQQTLCNQGVILAFNQIL